MNVVTQTNKKKLVIPHTYTIIFSLIVIMSVLTWIIPSGEFSRKEVNDRMVVVPGTYQSVESNPQGINDVFMAPINGFIDAAEVVGFVLLVGGSFGIVNKTGAIESGIRFAISKLKGKEVFIIPVSMVLFGLGGTTFGMAEETLPFYMILIPLMTSLGYDSLTAVGTIFLGALAGCTASTVNPFSVGIAQALSHITPGSGIEYRSIIFVVLMTIAITFMMTYAKRVKKNPTSSIVYEIDRSSIDEVAYTADTINKITLREVIVLLIFVIGMGTMVWGVLTQGWYIAEIAMVFIGIGVLSGIAGGLKQDVIATSFIDGAKDLALAAIAIALARGIVIIAQNGFIIDTILNASAILLEKLPKFIFINLTMIIEGALTFLIPSSSGLASLTMPVLSPLSDLVGISSQSIVTAYQFGSGLVNMITPTSGVLMGALAIANIPWSKWVKFVAPLSAILIVACMILLTISLYIGF